MNQKMDLVSFALVLMVLILWETCDGFSLVR
jgi:hypothetical protein